MSSMVASEIIREAGAFVLADEDGRVVLRTTKLVLAIEVQLLLDDPFYPTTASCAMATEAVRIYRRYVLMCEDEADEGNPVFEYRPGPSLRERREQAARERLMRGRKRRQRERLLTKTKEAEARVEATYDHAAYVASELRRRGIV